MTSLKPILDHVVVNVADKLDDAAALYERLGFQLTERGHHTLGSSNNLAIFGDTYLELIGFMPGREQKRADLWSHPLGLTGLVFRSPDPDLVFETVKGAGIGVEPPMHFARPVDLPDGARDAKFAVVRLAADEVPNGRVFFCHHYTRDLVWRPEWQNHANGVSDVAEFVIVAREPEKTVSTFTRMFEGTTTEQVAGGVSFAAGAARVTILTPDAATARFGDALPELPADGSDRMVALVFRTRSAEEADAALTKGGVEHRPFEGGHLVPATGAANVALGFKP
jgi:hypothetical protein